MGDIPMDTPGKNAIGYQKVGDTMDFKSQLKSESMVFKSKFKRFG